MDKTKFTYDPGTHFIQLNQHSTEPLLAQLDKDLKQSRVFSAAFQHIFSDDDFSKRMQKTGRSGLYLDFIDRVKRLKISDGLLFNVLKNGYSKKSFPTLSEQVAEFFTDKTYVLKELMPLVLNRLQRLEEKTSKTRTHLLPTIIVGAKEQLSILNPQTAKSKTLSIPLVFASDLEELPPYWKFTKMMTNTAFKISSVQKKISPAMLRPPKKRTTPFAVCVVRQTAKLPSLPKGCFPLDVRGNSLLTHLSKEAKLFRPFLQSYRKLVVHTTKKDSVLFFHQICRIRELAQKIHDLENDFLNTRGLEPENRARRDSEVGMQQVKMFTGEFKTLNIRERTHTIGNEGRGLRDEYLYHLQELIHRIDVLKGLKQKFTSIENGILTSLGISQQGLQTFVSKLYQEMQKQVPMSPRPTGRR